MADLLGRVLECMSLDVGGGIHCLPSANLASDALIKAVYVVIHDTGGILAT